MAFTIFDTLSDLPVVGIEPGEEGFVKETSSFYNYEDLSLLSSFSYSFDGNSSLSLTDSAHEVFDSSGSPFTIDFWSYTFGGNFPYFSAFVKTPSIDLSDISSDSNPIEYNISVNVLPTSPYTEEYGQSIFYNGDSAISEASLSSDMDLLSPYTIQYWSKNLSNSIFNISSLSDGSDILRIKGNEIISQQVPLSFSDDGYLDDIWEHHSVVYDGYEHFYYNNGQKKSLTRPANYNITPADISYVDFKKRDDASFQAKVFFSSNPTNGTLFLIGEDDLKTEISVSGNGSNLTFSCKDLTITTSDFPKDDQEHIISWDIQINPKRIRLWVDGSIKGEQAGGSSMSENAWVSGSNVYSEYPSGNILKSDLDIATGYARGSLNDPVEVFGKNITINPSSNARYTVFTFDNRDKFPLIIPGGSNIYYFEIEATGSGSSLTRPYLIDPNATIGNNTWYANRWWGMTVDNFKSGNVNTGGVNRFATGWAYPNRPNSFIIDEPASKIYSIRDGRTLVGVDDFSTGNMSTGSSTGFELGIELGPRYRWNRITNDPNEVVKVSFTSSAWAFDPDTVYRTVGAGDTEGGYASSTNFTSWAGVDISAKSLYYYPSTFKKITDGKVYNGKNFRDLSTVETGVSYAQEYIALTGGSIVNLSGGGNIDSTLDSMSTGDALVLGSGVYLASSTTETIFREKNFLICGSTSNPDDAVLNYTPNTSFRDHPIFNASSSGANRIAFLAFNRISTRTGNYSTALHKESKGGVSYRVNYKFNNSDVAWLYDSRFYASIKVFESCTFSNYSVWRGDYNGIQLSIISKNNAFEKLFSDTCTLSGYNDDNATFNFSGQSYSNHEYKGYLKDYSINSGIIYDSNFSTDSIQNNIDSNTLFFLDGTRAGDTLLSLNTEGSVIINNSAYQDSTYPNDVWTHHALSYDGDRLRTYKDGTLISEHVTDFEGYSLSDTTFYIGQTKVINSPTGNLKGSYYKGNLKEFRLADNAIYVDSNYTIPSMDRIFESGDIFVTANQGQVPDTDLITVLNNIESTLFSPYSSDARGWLRSGVVIKNWNSAVALGDDDVDFDFDSNSFLDSFGPNIILEFSEKDDEGTSLTWGYKANQIDEMFDIYRDSTNRKFLLERKLLDGKYISASSTFSFTSKKAGSDSEGRFNFIEKSDELVDGVTLEILADKFSVINNPVGTQFGLRNVSFEFVDSTTDLSGFVLDSSELYSIFADDINIRIYDSIGEFL